MATNVSKLTELTLEVRGLKTLVLDVMERMRVFEETPRRSEDLPKPVDSTAGGPVLLDDVRTHLKNLKNDMDNTGLTILDQIFLENAPGLYDCWYYYHIIIHDSLY